MPRLLRDFHCHACGKHFERFIDTEVFQSPCECGGVAQRVISLPTISLEGITGAFPGAHDRWARIREDNARIKKAREA